MKIQNMDIFTAIIDNKKQKQESKCLTFQYYICGKRYSEIESYDSGNGYEGEQDEGNGRWS